MALAKVFEVCTTKVIIVFVEFSKFLFLESIKNIPF